MRLFKSVSVFISFPKLLVTTFLFASLLTQPGEAAPRFVASGNSAKTASCDEVLLLPQRALRTISADVTKGIVAQIPIATPLNIAGGIICDLSDEQAASLANENEDLIIENLEQRLFATLTNFQSNNDPNASALWNYDLTGVANLNVAGFNGRGTRIGIIANDYSVHHTALMGRIKVYKNIGTVEPIRSTADLHLAHPLGILAGFDQGRFSGIAPEAEVTLAIISAKLPKTDSLMAALEWLTSQEMLPDAILICTDFNAPAPTGISRALAACRNLGIIPIIAAGNNPNQITGMAALPSCVTIGAIDRWQQWALFSGQGPASFAGQQISKPDYGMPGCAVLGPSDGKEYKLGTGTLQAAAHFAGIFLLLRQARPEIDPEYLLSAIRITCSDLGEPGQDFQTGHGLPSPLAALSYIDHPPQNQLNRFTNF